MKKIVTLIASLFFSIAAFSQTPVPAGFIYGTWTLEGSPYLIQGLTSVPDDSTLTIEARVEVIWQGSYTMYIDGQILALGTATDSILFTAADHEAGFNSIRFIETDPANDTSRFEYCIFEYGNVYGFYPDNCGGAIALIDFSKVVIDHCLFRYNQAIADCVFPEISSGGAMALWGSDAVIRNSTFLNNTANAGGAIVCYLESDALIENNTFIGNSAIIVSIGKGYAGALYCVVDSDPTIQYNIFHDNVADQGGGAFACIDGCNPLLHHNLFYNDTAGWGGAIEVQDNCMPQIINNTIAYNHAYNWGGGIHLWTGCTTEVRNSILWGNTAAEGGQIQLMEFDDLINVYYSDVMGGEAGVVGDGSVVDWVENIDDDPLFEESDTCYYHLTEGSPCIDAGGPFCFDPDSTPCDMGAFWCNYMGVGIPVSLVPGSGFRVEVYPNPAHEIFNVQFTVYNVQRISSKIYDLYGREVRMLMDEVKAPGEYTTKVDVSDLPAGVYLIRLQISGQSAVKKLIVH